MAASVGTVSTYVLFMYSLRLHGLEYSTYMYTLAKACRLVGSSHGITADLYLYN